MIKREDERRDLDAHNNTQEWGTTLQTVTEKATEVQGVETGGGRSRSNQHLTDALQENLVFDNNKNESSKPFRSLLGNGAAELQHTDNHSPDHVRETRHKQIGKKTCVQDVEAEEEPSESNGVLAKDLQQNVVSAYNKNNDSESVRSLSTRRKEDDQTSESSLDQVAETGQKQISIQPFDVENIEIESQPIAESNPKVVLSEIMKEPVTRVNTACTSLVATSPSMSSPCISIPVQVVGEKESDNQSTTDNVGNSVVEQTDPKLSERITADDHIADSDSAVHDTEQLPLLNNETSSEISVTKGKARRATWQI